MAEPIAVPAEAPRQRRSLRQFAVILALVVVAWGGLRYVGLLGGSGSGDQSGTIAAQIGGTCGETGYYVQSRLDGSKLRIYDCTTPSRGEMCVTYSGGIASDSTDEVKLLFANELGGSKPACAT